MRIIILAATILIYGCAYAVKTNKDFFQSFESIKIGDRNIVKGYVRTSPESRGIYPSWQFSEKVKNSCIVISKEEIIKNRLKSGQIVEISLEIEAIHCGKDGLICFHACRNYMGKNLKVISIFDSNDESQN
jgi:hypothetical protein